MTRYHLKTVVLGEAVEFGDVEAGGDGVDILYALFFEVLYGEGFEHVGGVVVVVGVGDAVLKELGFYFVKDGAGTKGNQLFGVGVENAEQEFFGPEAKGFFKVVDVPFGSEI